ncbi:MAG: fibronectin type III domain-containing protein [Chloroflexota bacterium]
MTQLRLWSRLTAVFPILITLFLLIEHPTLNAAPTSDPTLPLQHAVEVSAIVQTSPPQITLHWPAYILGNPDPNGSSHTIYRKPLAATNWSQIATLPLAATSYSDTNVVVGTGYDYKIVRQPSDADAKYGFIYAGIDVPLTEQRGKLLLLVDNTVTTPLASELSRLEQDLVGDGWQVVRQEVARDETVANVRALVQSLYWADPANVKALFLFGHIPIPYSGNFAPDGHWEHQGAWPTDLFYADVDGSWGDSSVNHTGAVFAQNHNVPGDGKFDPSYLHEVYATELLVGRVDLADMPVFAPKTEVDLLRQYLDKDHAFRHGQLTAVRRGLVEENFSSAGLGFLAYSSWANFAPLFGQGQTFDEDWSTLTSSSALWAYGSGPGWFDSAAGIGNSWDFANNEYQVIFTMLLGSYFGEWSSQNNFLRAPLAMSGYGLTAVWAGIPDFYFQHMALGETVGYSTWLSQNLSGVVYDHPTLEAQGIHMALMGDPTLRLHAVVPPTNPTVAPNPSQGVDIRWQPSPDTVLGYHVYSAATAAGPFTRLTTNPVAATHFTDTRPAEPRHYLVRAVKRETSGSGTYLNLSQGIFVASEITAVPVAPALYITIVMNGVRLNWEPVTTNINQSATEPTQYDLFRTPTPYTPRLTPYASLPAPFTPPLQLTDSPTAPMFYALTAVNENGRSAPSHRIGFFSFPLTNGN